MAPSSYFSLPLFARYQDSSLRASQYRPKKRKRRTDDESDRESISTTTSVEDDTPEPPSGTDFPHASLEASTGTGHPRGYVKSAQVQAELAALNPPLYSSEPTSTGREGLRRRHLAVLTTILHRCLLTGDFERAGRAWALILRSGMSVDLRSQGRWGIGAEILLRRGMGQFPGPETDGLTSWNDDSIGADERRHEAFKAKFERAREYFQRLILQYPFFKAHRDTINALDFYPAMFSLWIYAVQYERNLAERELLMSKENSPGSEQPYTNTSGDDQGSHISVNEEESMVQKEAIRTKALAAAEEIGDRLEELLVSPPYSDSLHLQNIKGMLDLWLSDLCVPTNMSTTNGQAPNSPSSTSRKRERHLESARRAFGKVRNDGGTLWKGAEDVLNTR